MKATVEKQPETFTPVVVMLTLETQAELDALGSIFNTVPVTDGWENLTGNQGWLTIYNQLEAVGANTHRSSMFVGRR